MDCRITQNLCRNVVPVLGLALLVGGCGTIRKAAVNSMADMLASDQAGGVFASDDDPELVRAALPFGLKTHEMLLANAPRNRKLHTATGRAFIQYAAGFVDWEAQKAKPEDLARSRELGARAKRLYLRGRDYAMGALELRHPGFDEALRREPDAALAHLDGKDVPALFWAAAGWFGAISSDRSNMQLVAEQSFAEAMIRRALELQEDFDHGAIHEFMILLEGGRGELMGGVEERARHHFKRAVAISGGRKASPYVALASTVCVARQNVAEFKRLLKTAIAIDVNRSPEWRLANLLAQEKAQWLLKQGPELFLDYEESE